MFCVMKSNQNSVIIPHSFCYLIHYQLFKMCTELNEFSLFSYIYFQNVLCFCFFSVDT